MSADVDLAGLRAAAEAARGVGDWYAGSPSGDDSVSDIRDCFDVVDATDAAFIALTTPDIVLSLIDRVQAAEAAVGRVRAMAKGAPLLACNGDITRWLDGVQ